MPGFESMKRVVLHLICFLLIVGGVRALASLMVRQTRAWKRPINMSLAEARTHNKMSNTEDKLAVMVLSQDPQQLCCALKNWSANVFASTPADVYVFSIDSSVEDTFYKTCELTISSFSNLAFMRLREHWETPDEAGDPSLWTDQGASANYRRMGHWRLTFQMEFVASLGYKYVLQVDDDSAFPDVLDFDLVHHLKAKDVWMAARTILPVDPDAVLEVTIGLPELARYFLVTEHMQPTILYEEDCDPPNITGLYTSGAGGVMGGYSTRYLYGNFVIISLDFWFQEQVQRFVRLVLATGGHFRFRWNEQQVQSIIWQMFVPSDKFHAYTFDYVHDISTKSWHEC